MYAVVFEVQPKHFDDYLRIAGELKSELEKIDGFLSVERFCSLVEDGKILPLSFWRDEVAIKRWCKQIEHRAAQRKGRGAFFKDYRLRVASMVRDYGMTDREQATSERAVAHTD